MKELRSFKTKIIDYVDKAAKGESLAHVSVYFRDLNNGPWIGINEHAEFVPGSLLKVPMMVSLLRRAETEPGLLDTLVVFKPGMTAPEEQRFGVKSILQPGRSYTVDFLLSEMIGHSDNIATLLLFDRFGVEGIRAIYDDLGIPTPPDGVPSTLQVKSYASIFRILYNASYLGRKMSEKGLAYLSDTEFSVGITAGVPVSLPVAHKYGERVVPENNLKQLHDCGVVYYPGHPYILCVMTHGGDYDKLARTIREVSAIVYQEVSAQFPRR